MYAQVQRKKEAREVTWFARGLRELVVEPRAGLGSSLHSQRWGWRGKKGGIAREMRPSAGSGRTEARKLLGAQQR